MSWVSGTTKTAGKRDSVSILQAGLDLKKERRKKKRTSSVRRAPICPLDASLSIFARNRLGVDLVVGSVGCGAVRSHCRRRGCPCALADAVEPGGPGSRYGHSCRGSVLKTDLAETSVELCQHHLGSGGVVVVGIPRRMWGEGGEVKEGQEIGSARVTATDCKASARTANRATGLVTPSPNSNVKVCAPVPRAAPAAPSVCGWLPALFPGPIFAAAQS